MCASCKSKKGLYGGKNNPNYKGGVTTESHVCKEYKCKNVITYQAWYNGNGRCRSCARKHEFANGRSFSDNHRKAISKSKTGNNHPKWAPIGSTYICADGYIIEKAENKWAAQHKLVVERFLHRPLKKGEVVHHINENRSDNNIENLYIFTKRGLHSCFTQLVKHGIIQLNILKSNLQSIKNTELQND
jgi:hypothetical protein